MSRLSTAESAYAAVALVFALTAPVLEAEDSVTCQCLSLFLLFSALYPMKAIEWPLLSE